MGFSRLGLCAVATLAACGDPAVDGTYEGKAELEMHGLICAIGKMDSSTTALGVAWTTLAPDATRLHTLPGETDSVDARKLPANFDMPLYDKPPAGAVTTIGGYDVSIGIPFMFDDLDGDGVFSEETEPLLGVSRGQVVLYSSVATSDGGVPLELTAPPLGWSVGKLVCDDSGTQLVGVDLVATDSRFDVWLYDGVIVNPLGTLAPKTCLYPY
jgi:hypothetical protein